MIVEKKNAVCLGGCIRFGSPLESISNIPIIKEKKQILILVTEKRNIYFFFYILYPSNAKTNILIFEYKFYK